MWHYYYLTLLKQAFKQEIAWATHLSLSAIILPTPAFNSANYARVINQITLNLSYMHAWLRIPILSAKGKLEMVRRAVFSRKRVKLTIEQLGVKR